MKFAKNVNNLSNNPGKYNRLQFAKAVHRLGDMRKLITMLTHINAILEITNKRGFIHYTYIKKLTNIFLFIIKYWQLRMGPLF